MEDGHSHKVGGATTLYTCYELYLVCHDFQRKKRSPIVDYLHKFYMYGCKQFSAMQKKLKHLDSRVAKS